MPSFFTASLAVAALVLIADTARASSGHSGILARKSHHVQRAGKVVTHKEEKRAKAGNCTTKPRNGSMSPSKNNPSRNTTSCGYLPRVSPYKLVQDSAGANFFDDWEFFTDADPTHGNVDYQSVDASWASNLISIGPNSLIGTNKTLAALSEPITASMKVDDQTWLAPGENRKSVRVVSKDSFKYGLLVLDAVKMPYGCSTWPAFWTVGGNWPNGGEIDIVEGVNVITTNQMTLHTSPGCTLEGNMRKSATGNILSNTCDATINSNTGCGVQDPTDTSYGAGFNAAGGGVFAMEWDTDGIAMWHFERKDIPSDLYSKAPVPSEWGAPAAFWSSSSCDMNQYFDAQSIVFDITLCGDWAGAVFNQGGCSGSCADAVMDPGNFKHAQWSPPTLPPPTPVFDPSFSTTVPTFKASKAKGKGKSAGGRDDLGASETVEAGLKTVVVNAKGKGKKGRKGGMVDVEDIEGESADYNYDPTLSSKGKKKSGMIDTSSIGTDILENSHFSLPKASAAMSSAVERLKKAIVPLLNRVGRISPSILDEVRVDMPGGEGEEGKGEVVPLSAMASVTVLNAEFLAVECYDPSYTRPVSTALYNSPHLNLTPQPHSATTLHLKIPPLTTSHRQQIHASTAPIIEAARVEIRAARQKGQKDSKKDVDAKLVSGEEGKRDGKLLDEETKKWIKEVEKIEASAKKVILDE